MNSDEIPSQQRRIPKTKSAQCKQKVKIQQIMSISFENLVKKPQSSPIVDNPQPDTLVTENTPIQSDNVEQPMETTELPQEQVKRFSFSHPVRQSVSPQEQEELSEILYVQTIMQEDEKQHFTDDSQDISLLQQKKLSIASEQVRKQSKPIQSNKKVSSINNMFDNFLNQRQSIKPQDIKTISDQQSDVVVNKFVVDQDEEDIQSQQMQQNLQIDADLDNLISDLYESTTKQTPQIMLEYDKILEQSRVSKQQSSINGNPTPQQIQKPQEQPQSQQLLTSKDKQSDQKPQTYKQQQQVITQEIVQQPPDKLPNFKNSPQKLNLKNDQREITISNNNSNNKIINPTQPIQKNRYVNNKPKEITFRNEQYDVMTIHQFLFKYNLMKSDTQLDKLLDYSEDQIIQHYGQGVLQFSKSNVYNFNDFKKAIQTKDPEFWQLISDNFIIYATGVMKDDVGTKWQSHYLSSDVFTNYARSLGFVISEVECRKIIEQIQARIQNQGGNINQFSFEESVFGVFLIQKQNPSLQGLEQSLDFFAEGETKHIEIAKATDILINSAETLTIKQIHSVFGALKETKTVEESAIFKLLTLLPY